MNRRVVRAPALLWALGLMLGAALASAVVVHAQTTVTSAPYVRVIVDGEPVSFDVPPVVAAGRLLVPLRGVFHRLGAVVTWDAGTQTVRAARGDTGITLHIGDTQAHINGQPTLMDVPALLVDGRTMVPLRFISQALGSQVSWDAASTTVQIAGQPQYGLPPSHPYPPAAQPPVSPAPTAAPATVAGVLLDINIDSAGRGIYVQVDKAVHRYSVTPGTAISRINVADNMDGSEALPALRPGDQVQVTADSNGVASSIRATYKEAAGRIVAVTEAGAVLLDNGDTYRLNRSARVTRGTQVVDAGALRPGAVVQLRLNPQTNEIWGATLRQEQSPRGLGTTSVEGTPPGVLTITSPAEGAALTVPFTVTGQARPGSRVKVTADYDGSVLVLTVNRSLGSHTVTADRRGDWAVSFTDAPPLSGLSLTITAVEVDDSGRPVGPATKVAATAR